MCFASRRDRMKNGIEFEINICYRAILALWAVWRVLYILQPLNV